MIEIILKLNFWRAFSHSVYCVPPKIMFEKGLIKEKRTFKSVLLQRISITPDISDPLIHSFRTIATTVCADVFDEKCFFLPEPGWQPMCTLMAVPKNRVIKVLLLSKNISNNNLDVINPRHDHKGWQDEKKFCVFQEWSQIIIRLSILTTIIIISLCTLSHLSLV